MKGSTAAVPPVHYLCLGSTTKVVYTADIQLNSNRDFLGDKIRTPGCAWNDKDILVERRTKTYFCTHSRKIQRVCWLKLLQTPQLYWLERYRSVPKEMDQRI